MSSKSYRLKNVSPGWRGILGSDDGVTLASGEAGDFKLSETDLEDALATGWFELERADAEDSDEPAALSGKNREELELIAADEGVDLSGIEGSGKNGNVLNSDIVAAIEAAREN